MQRFSEISAYSYPELLTQHWFQYANAYSLWLAQMPASHHNLASMLQDYNNQRQPK